MAAVPGDAIAINASAGAPAYTAAEWRRAIAANFSPKGTAGSTPFGSSEGPRLGYGANLVALAGSTITVKAHAGVISPDLSLTQGGYLYQLPGDSTFTLAAAHATLVRNDLVTIRLDDHDEDGSGQRQAIPDYVQGTPGAGVPALPARSVELARINVPASGGGAASVTERNRWSASAGGIVPVRDGTDRDATNLTPYAGRVVYRLDTNRFEYRGASAYRTLEVVVACTSGTRPVGQAGLVIYETDTDRELIFDGTIWTLPKNRAGGLMAAPAERNSNIGPFTTETDLTGLSVTWSASSDRYYRLRFWARGISSTVAGDNAQLYITDASNNHVSEVNTPDMTDASVAVGPIVAERILSGLSGSQTYKCRGARTAGTGNLTIGASSVAPATFTVEDVGGV